MGRSWKSIRSKEMVEKIREHSRKKEKKAVTILKKLFPEFTIKWINQDGYKTHKDRKPDIVICDGDKVICYVEFSSTERYCLKKNPKFKLSKTLRVEADKCDFFKEGYDGKPILFCYHFADNYIKFCKFSEMKYRGYEVVKSFGQDETSENYVIDAKNLYDIEIVKENGEYVCRKKE